MSQACALCLNSCISYQDRSWEGEDSNIPIHWQVPFESLIEMSNLLLSWCLA